MYFPFNLWWLFLFPWTLLHLTVVTLLLRTRLLPAFLLCVVCAARLTNALEASSTLWVFQILLVRLVISFSLCVWIPCSFAHMGNCCEKGKKEGSHAEQSFASWGQRAAGWQWLVVVGGAASSGSWAAENQISPCFPLLQISSFPLRRSKWYKKKCSVTPFSPGL